jgi:hypothetical protein
MPRACAGAQVFFDGFAGNLISSKPRVEAKRISFLEEVAKTKQRRKQRQ